MKGMSIIRSFWNNLDLGLILFLGFLIFLVINSMQSDEFYRMAFGPLYSLPFFFAVTFVLLGIIFRRLPFLERRYGDLLKRFHNYLLFPVFLSSFFYMMFISFGTTVFTPWQLHLRFASLESEITRLFASFFLSFIYGTLFAFATPALGMAFLKLTTWIYNTLVLEKGSRNYSCTLDAKNISSKVDPSVFGKFLFRYLVLIFLISPVLNVQILSAERSIVVINVARGPLYLLSIFLGIGYFLWETKATFDPQKQKQPVSELFFKWVFIGVSLTLVMSTLSTLSYNVQLFLTSLLRGNITMLFACFYAICEIYLTAFATLIPIIVLTSSRFTFRSSRRIVLGALSLIIAVLSIEDIVMWLQSLPGLGIFHEWGLILWKTRTGWYPFFLFPVPIALCLIGMVVLVSQLKRWTLRDLVGIIIGTTLAWWTIATFVNQEAWENLFWTAFLIAFYIPIFVSGLNLPQLKKPERTRKRYMRASYPN